MIDHLTISIQHTRATLKVPDLSSLVLDASRYEGIEQPEGDFWLFAYGSLMWNPEFEYLRRETARLYGYHRRLCLWSVEHRGTLQRPGLVMGLDQGGSCRGQAFLISQNVATQTIDQLNQREMITGAYRSQLKSLHLDSGEKVDAVCLIARQDHPQYARKLDHRITIDLVKSAHGGRGSNQEYVLNTAQQLREMGVRDRHLEEIVQGLS